MYKIIMENIRIKITLLLIISISIIFTIFSAYQYSVDKEHLTNDLESSVERKIKRLSKNLTVPLWEIDSRWVNEIVTTEMMDKELYAVLISGDGNLNVNKKRDNNWNLIELTSEIDGDYIKRSASVIRDDEKLGEVTLYITRKFLKEELYSRVIQKFISNTMVILFLIIFLYIVLNRIILRPINDVLKTVQAVADGDLSNKVKFTQNDEIGKLGNEFNNMMQKVQDKEDMIIAQSRHAAMGEMISMIAHQWRQPITAIAMGANNIILDVELDELKPESAKKSALAISEQTQHLSKTIDDFKNFFRPNKHIDKVFVNDIIEESFHIIGKSLENNGIAVKKIYSSKVEISLFSRELLQVLINIIKNAKEALIDNNIEDPLITIKTNDRDENIDISICNNGKGIDDEIMKSIFEPYFTTKSEKTGTGLGLYMSRTIVQKHLHGTLLAKNIESGGVCFNISIPINGANNG